MNFNEIIVKDNPGLCRCCLSEGCYKDLSTEYSWMDDCEVYADMLLECYDISISQHIEGPNGPSRLICEVCITRLRDASNFKKQVLASEKKFIDMVANGDFKPKAVIIYEAPKLEPEPLPGPSEEDGEVEYLEEDMEFEYQDDHDDETLQKIEVQDITVSTLPIKGKRGKKSTPETKSVKKAKASQSTVDVKPSKSTNKGKRPMMTLGGAEETNLSSLTSTKRNRLMKRNAIIVLESSNVCPFKWHRQSYLCFFCHRDFKDPALLKEHTVRDHKRSSIKAAVNYLRRDEKVKIDVTCVNCQLCDMKFENLNELTDHLNSTHNKTFFDNPNHGMIPYKLQSNDFQCAVCADKFQYFIKLNQHMNKHYGTYVCDACGKSFLSTDRLRCHALTHGSKFRCSACPEIFESLTQKVNHERKEHDIQRVLKCIYCKETFKNYSLRKKHHRTVHSLDIPEYHCPVCGKAFQIMSKMKIHVKEVHVKEKNYSCPMCEQKFFSKTHVQKHMVKHVGKRIHECEICKKSYARKQTLRDHMRVHSAEKCFVCYVCSKDFVQNNSLKLHMRVHHPDAVTG